MKKILELTYGRSLKLNKGNFEQDSPLFSEKLIIESDNGEAIDREKEFNDMKSWVDSQAEAYAEKHKIDTSNLRIRIIDGKNYVSVTSILNPDPLQIDPEYGIRGNEIHRLINLYLQTGKWEVPKEPLSKLKYDDIPYQKFFEEHEKEIDFTKAKTNVELYNKKHLYSGEADIYCLVNGIYSLCDFKTGSWTWEQVMAYWKCAHEVEPEQLAIFDLKNNKIETLKPKTSKAYEYWENFLIKRGRIKERFGL